MEKWDPAGAVFVPALERGVTRPCYAYGHDPKAKDPVFTCPVSAIPDEVWTLLDLFLTCRAMKSLPKAGGVLDQPLIVRRVWPVFEAEMERHERQSSVNGSMVATTAMLTALLGRRR